MLLLHNIPKPLIPSTVNIQMSEYYLKVPLALGLFLIVWRLWTFTVKPSLCPMVPKEMPYWIPFLGHTISFFRDCIQLMEDGLNSIDRTREVFAIQLLGQKLYICTEPEEVSSIFENQKDFNFDNHLTNLLISFGISPQALKRAWQKPMPGDKGYIPNNPLNPKQKSLIHHVEEVYKRQLLPGEHMETLRQAFLGSVLSSMRGMKDLSFCMAQNESIVPVYSLVSFFNVQATTKAMFGCSLHEIDSSVVRHMIEFNKHVWMIVFRFPNIIGLAVDKPRQKLAAIMRRFIELPSERRAESSWAIRNVLDGMQNLDMDMESKASMLLMIYWAAVSNEHNACYWLLIHLLYNSTLFKEVRQETEAAWQSGRLDIKYLCAHCPILESVFNEVLRLNNTASAVRVASKDTQIGGKVLKAGSTIVMPFRHLHLNENVWGPDALAFDHTRFLSDKSRTRSPAFRPFGGGATLCPGQALAKQEIFGFIAILLHRFHVSLLTDKSNGDPPFPRLDSMKPSFGLNGPLDSTDILMSISEIGADEIDH